MRRDPGTCRRDHGLIADTAPLDNPLTSGIHELLETVDPLRYAGWDSLLERHPEGSVFHSSAWARILAETYGYAPRYLLKRSSGGISILFPVMEVNSRLTGRRGVALPFSDYCDPIYSDAESLNNAWSHLISEGRNAKWKSLELRCRGKLPETFESSSTFFHHLLELEGGEDVLFRRLRGSTQRNIRKSEKEGVTVSISGSEDSVAEFYRLNCMTRRDHGLPPQPMSFFRNLHEHILKKDAGFIALAHFRGTCIAANVYLLFGDRAYYKYGASDRKSQHLRANNLLMWEAIRSCARRGFRSLCFGRTETENEGLRQFKNGWGAQEGLLRYYKYDLLAKGFVISGPAVSGWHNKVFRNLPIPLSRAIGTVFYRHMA